jgi:hypothetical protein
MRALLDIDLSDSRGNDFIFILMQRGLSTLAKLYMVPFTP